MGAEPLATSPRNDHAKGYMVFRACRWAVALSPGYRRETDRVSPHLLVQSMDTGDA